MLLGLLPFKYNKEKRTFRSSGVALSYSVVINTLLFAWVVKNWPDMSNYELFAKPLLYIVENVVSYLNCVGIILIFCSTWSGRKRLLRLFNEIVTVRQLCDSKAFLRDFDASMMEKRIILKFCSMFLQNLLFFSSSFYWSNKMDASYFLVSMLTIILFNEILLISNQFYHNTLSINHSILAVNHRLRCLNTRKQLLAAGEINEIFGIYIRLIRLITHTTKAYEKQLLVIISVRLSVIVQCLFSACMHFGGRGLQMNELELLYFLLIIMLTSLDYWLIMAVCESVWRAQQQTKVELKHFNTFRTLSVDLARDLNTFSIFCSIHKFRFPLCGLFEIHFATARNLCTSVVTALIWLVQYDFATSM
ncbi:putative gustatory receptor 22d [Bactrocera tryoni]|uniref:putative gustatory receptor 22d n=1 Tax=Bactrocera tryoni TaxID=59916 RepID=UPI001A963142|nr:putative gustatory receptor 22d [Bactrocera tryoni]